MNTLPKSLHTVSTLVAIARELRAIDSARPGAEMGAEFYVARAVRILGYECSADTYELRAVALRKLAKG